ncbi:MAG: LysE family transporter [Gemmatimonadota bacterium]|jgi:threonine/homoserine/homoserine lactone efflux protein
MVRTLILGSLLGLFSGVVPGPFTALIAVTALRHGFWAGFRVAVIPLVSETTVMTLTALLLSQLPSGALRWMGIIGGLFVVFIAVRTYRESGEDPVDEPTISSRRRTLESMMFAVLSPAPWVFWLLVGSPLFLGAYHQGWGNAAAFLGAFLLVFVGVYVGVARAASLGHQRLSNHWYRRVMVGAAIALGLAGAVLVWQSWIGNFHRMVSGSESLTEILTDTLHMR